MRKRRIFEHQIFHDDAAGRSSLEEGGELGPELDVTCRELTGGEVLEHESARAQLDR